jgi:RNA polymerase-binding transcription factor DksA
MDTETQLNEALHRIIGELKDIAHHNTETDDWEAIPDQTQSGEADPNSEADIAEEWEERRATVAALETEYRDIKRALAKIAAGTYGLCEISGESIEPDRLAIKPTARTCKAHMNDEAMLPL